MKSRAAHLVRNAVLAGGTAVEHLGDDPVMLALQVSRRLPSRLLQPLLRALAQAPGRGTLPTLEALLRGDKHRLETNLQDCVQGGTSDGHRLRMADLATAAGLPELAAELLAGVRPTAGGRRGTEARLRWYNGDMHGAVRALDGGSGRENAQQRRLAAEARVFDGWQPKLPKVLGYQPKPQTVLHVLTNSLPHTQSGYSQRTHSILKAQQDLGWSVHAVTRLGYPVQVGKLGARDTEVIDGVVYHRLLPARMPFGLDRRLQRQAEEMVALARVLQPAVLHTTTHFTNALVTAAVAEALGIPWVYEVRGQLADTWASSRGVEAALSERYRAFVARENDATLRADGCATLGTAMKSGIFARGGAEQEIALLPNGVGEAFLIPPMSAAEARRQLGLPVKGIFIGTVSSLVDYEGLDDLIAAFTVLAGSNTTLMCLIVGAGTAENSLRQQAGQSGLGDRIIFTGSVNRELAHLYHQALDIFVLPRKDSEVTRSVTPLKPVEALASGRPVVFADLPALRETIMDRVEGTAVQAGDREGLALAIASLAANPEKRNRMGFAGRSRMMAERTWPVTALRTIAMYERLRVSQ